MHAQGENLQKLQKGDISGFVEQVQPSLWSPELLTALQSLSSKSLSSDV